MDGRKRVVWLGDLDGLDARRRGGGASLKAIFAPPRGMCGDFFGGPCALLPPVLRSRNTVVGCFHRFLSSLRGPMPRHSSFDKPDPRMESRRAAFWTALAPTGLSRLWNTLTLFTHGHSVGGAGSPRAVWLRHPARAFRGAGWSDGSSVRAGPGSFATCASAAGRARGVAVLLGKLWPNSIVYLGFFPIKDPFPMTSGLDSIWSSDGGFDGRIKQIRPSMRIVSNARSPLWLVLRCAPRAATLRVFLLAETKSNAFETPVLVKKMVPTTAERMSAAQWGLDRVPYGSADSVLQAVAGSPVCQMAAGRPILCWQPAGSTDIWQIGTHVFCSFAACLDHPNAETMLSSCCSSAVR